MVRAKGRPSRPGLTLSIVGDPRYPCRRRSGWDYLAYTIFLLRYCTPKFMNLEAGADWKKRLWRSLGDAKCGFIDVSELTASVAAKKLSLLPYRSG